MTDISTATAHSAGLDFDKLKIAPRYAQARDLTEDARAIWKKVIIDSAPPTVSAIADVGTGTGRFLDLLQESFPSAILIGVEPAISMVSEAAILHPDLFARGNLLQGACETLPLVRAGFDVVFMSMVFHALGDTERAIKDLAAVLRPGGRLMLRQVTKEHVSDQLYFKFFPSASEIAMRFVPATEEIVAACKNAGLDLVSHSQVEAPTAKDMGAYVAKIELRGTSVLSMLSDQEFNEGRARLQDYARHHCEPVLERTDLFVFEAR